MTTEELAKILNELSGRPVSSISSHIAEVYMSIWPGNRGYMVFSCIDGDDYGIFRCYPDGSQDLRPIAIVTDEFDVQDWFINHYKITD